MLQQVKSISGVVELMRKNMCDKVKELERLQVESQSSLRQLSARLDTSEDKASVHWEQVPVV